MPFISKDWRSPGEQWVKIGPGWERAKVLNYLHSSYFQSGDGYEMRRDESIQPQYNVTTRTTREIRRQNTLSEALLQLDFYSACHDIRRFNYTCRMIQLLLFNMNCLPGNVQRILIKLVEEMAAYARENGWKGEVRHVLQAMRDNMQNPPVWGGQLGSTKLWEEHKLSIQKILSYDSDDNVEYKQPPPMQEFPEEVIRQVLLKLSCDKDIEALANSNLLLREIADENRVWRELCNYHFTLQQIQLIHEQLQKLKDQTSDNNTPVNNLKSKWSNNRYRNRNNNNQQKKEAEDNLKSQSSDGTQSYGDSQCHEEFDENQNNSSTSMNSDMYPHWKLKFKTLKRRYGLSKEEYAEELNLCKSCGLLFWTATHSAPIHDCGVPILIPVKPGDFIKYFCV